MIPHFTFPFEFVADVNGTVSAAVNDQDTIEDITACVYAILQTPLGYREEMPDFGLRDLTFSEGSVNVDEIQVAISQWEPRADVLIEEDPSMLQDFVDLVTVTPNKVTPITPQIDEGDV